MTLNWSGLFLGCFLGIQEHKHCFPVPGLSRCTCEVFSRFMILRETDCMQAERSASPVQALLLLVVRGRFTAHSRPGFRCLP